MAKTEIIVNEKDELKVYVKGIPFPVYRYENGLSIEQKCLLAENGFAEHLSNVHEKLDNAARIINNKDENYTVSEHSDKIITWELEIALYQTKILGGENIYDLINDAKKSGDYHFHMSAIVKAYKDLIKIGFVGILGEITFVEDIKMTPIETYAKTMIRK